MWLQLRTGSWITRERIRGYSILLVLSYAIALAALAAFGPETFAAFFDSLTFSRVQGVEYSNTGFHKLQSAFTAARLLGGSVGLAYVLHGLLLALVLAAIPWIWRSPADGRLKAASLMTGSIVLVDGGYTCW